MNATATVQMAIALSCARPVRCLAALAAALALAGHATAQTTVKDAWVRGTVAQQTATGAFLQILSPAGGRLVSVNSPVAANAELHEMAMEGDTMRMRALPEGLPLPAGKWVALAPGGNHVMLTGLKAALKSGEPIDLSLVVEGADGRRETLQVKAAVRPLGAAAPAATPHQH